MLFFLLGCTGNDKEPEVVEDTTPVISTVFCSDIEIGDTLEVDGILYTKQDREGLDILIENEDWEGLETSCTSDITDMSLLFQESLFSIVTTSFDGDISTWDTSSVIDMSYMFLGAADFNTDISSWDVSNVTNMVVMFDGASSFNGDISGWDVSNVTDAAASGSTDGAIEGVEESGADVDVNDVTDAVDSGIDQGSEDTDTDTDTDPVVTPEEPLDVSPSSRQPENDTPGPV